MHKRALFAHYKSRTRGQHHTDDLDEKRPLAQKPSNYKTAQYGLYLGQARARCVWRKHSYQKNGEKSKKHGPQRVEYIADDVFARTVLPVAKHLIQKKL